MELNDLLTQIALPPDDIKPLVEGLVSRDEILQLGLGEHSLLLALAAWNNLLQDAKKVLQEYHSKFPIRTGIPKTELTNRLKLGKYAPMVLERLVTEKALIDEGMVLRLPDFNVKLSPVQQAKIDVFLKAMAEQPYAPPSELIPEPDL